MELFWKNLIIYYPVFPCIFTEETMATKIAEIIDLFPISESKISVGGLFLCRSSYLTISSCSPNHYDLKVNHYDLKVQLHELAIFITCTLRSRWSFISVALRFSRPKPDSKPTPNSDMASCNLNKMSLIYFNFHNYF